MPTLAESRIFRLAALATLTAPAALALDGVAREVDLATAIALAHVALALAVGYLALLPRRRA